MEYRLNQVTARCPACHTDHAEQLWRVEAAEAAQHYVLREVHPARHRALRDHIESLWGASTCDVLRCTDCGFGFAHPFVAGDAQFYALAYDRTGYPAWKWEYDRTVKALDQADLPAAFSLLEIGAGDGAFLRRVTPSQTPRDRVLATEFSDYGRRSIEALGVRCVAHDVRALPLDAPGAPFDVVCLFQVLEHLDGLDALAAHLAALTAPNGHLFAAVPNAERIAFNERHGSLLDMPPNHVGRWTRAAFGALAARHGWYVEAHEVEPERLSSQLRQLVVYRYMRRRQDARSLANRVERISNPALRTALRIATAAVSGLTALPTAAALARRGDLGDTQWVHLRRAPT